MLDHVVDLGGIGGVPLWFFGQLSFCPQESGLDRLSVTWKCGWILYPGVPGVPVGAPTVVISSYIHEATLHHLQLSLFSQGHLLATGQFPQRQPPHL